MNFDVIDYAIGADVATPTGISLMFNGVVDMIQHLVVSLWPVLIGVFLLFGIWGYIKYKAKSIGR